MHVFLFQTKLLCSFHQSPALKSGHLIPGKPKVRNTDRNAYITFTSCPPPPPPPTSCSGTADDAAGAATIEAAGDALPTSPLPASSFAVNTAGAILGPVSMAAASVVVPRPMCVGRMRMGDALDPAGTVVGPCWFFLQRGKYDVPAKYRTAAAQASVTDAYFVEQYSSSNQGAVNEPYHACELALRATAVCCGSATWRALCAKHMRSSEEKSQNKPHAHTHSTALVGPEYICSAFLTYMTYTQFRSEHR